MDVIVGETRQTLILTDADNFGFIGCRDSVPHLQRLAVYSREALEELERSA